MAPRNTDASVRTAKQAKLVAIVLVATMVLWMGANFIGAELGLPTRWLFLFDFAALGAFIWTLIVTFGIWRARQSEKD
jgi:hypothetical protein